MAIDSADKRSSAMSLLTDMVVAMTPDGSIVALDRQHVAGFYRGIAAADADAVPDSEGLHWTLPANRFDFTLPANRMDFVLKVALALLLTGW